MSIVGEDISIVEGLIGKDRATQKYVYEMYFKDMVAIPMRYGNTIDEAYGILNEAFLKVFNSIKNYNDRGQLKAWISKIVFNTTMDYLRKNLKYKKYLELDDSSDYDIVVNDALQNLGLEEIYQHIHNLPENERSIFSLFVIDGRKHKEISELLNIAVGTSKWYLNNARKLLQSSLTKVGYER